MYVCMCVCMCENGDRVVGMGVDRLRVIPVYVCVCVCMCVCMYVCVRMVIGSWGLELIDSG
jgi:hypothetical protein